MGKDVNCLTCRFCLRDDYGYSNYTTEGTTLECLRGLNAALKGKEDPWHEDDMATLAPILDVAESCPSYRPGVPAHMDVDQENVPWDRASVLADFMPHYTDDPEVAAILLARFGRTAP